MNFDPRPYIEGIKRANKAEQAEIERRAHGARREAGLLAARIAECDRAVHRVLLFGSLAQACPTRLDFDIDLACDGGDIYSAMSIGEESEFPVDIVDLNRLPEHVRRRIETDGVLLFKR